MVTKSIRSIVLMGSSALLVFGAQAADDKSHASDHSSKRTMTGCLSGGTNSNEFSFVEDGSGKKYTVGGQAELSKHAMNHTVRITTAGDRKAGNETRDRHATNQETSGGSEGAVLKVTNVEHVSDTCKNR